MHQQIEELTSVLGDLVSDSRAHLAVVFTIHGDVLAVAYGETHSGSMGPASTFVPTSLALMSAGLLGLTDRIGVVTDQGRIEVASLVYGGGLALVAPCGSEAGLAVVAPPLDNLHGLRHYVSSVARDLAQRIARQNP